MQSIKFKAYGKINLYLSVGDKRADGFHEVETVMQKATVYDVITISKSEEKGIRLTSDGADFPCDETNLIYKAIVKLHEAIGTPIESLDHGYTADVEKHIPIAGGMGGGSADAGYTLKHLNEALGSPLTIDALQKIATELGSDVPFFIYGSDTMLATGRGEILTECPTLPPCRMEFRSCGKKPSTGAMFAELDRRREIENSADIIPLKNVLDALQRGNLREICENTFNSFETVFRSQNEICDGEFKRISEDMINRGALCVLLCGSGPTVCGIFE